MKAKRFDAVVIGSGPGGEGAAMTLAKSDRSVAVIEAYEDVGGGCTHWGTIPSKALRHSVQLLADYRSRPLYRKTVERLDVTFPALMESASDVVAKQVSMRRGFYLRNRVELVHGRARFVDPHCIEVDTPRESLEAYEAEHIVIATGSRPYRPEDVDFGHPCVHDSDSILRLEGNTSRSITIYGAGVIGCEYASIFTNLGYKVNLVNGRDRLLSQLDDEISGALGYHLRDQGVVIRNSEQYERMEYMDDQVTIHCVSGKRFRSDLVLWANGRTGNTDGMNLDGVGIGVDRRGNVEVDETYRTKLGHVFAVGDVAGAPGLASASYDQGRFAGTQIVEGRSDWKLLRKIPTGIYTSPEISSVGRTEQELTEQMIPYEVGRAMFKSIARAQITGHTVGMVKILFHPDTLEILGIHCFGEQAAEIVHIGQAIMSQKGEANTLMYFVNTTFNYPTMAEAYRVAALNGLNRVT